MKGKYTNDLPELVNENGITRLKILEENRRQREKSFQKQQRIIDTAEDTFRKIQLPKEFVIEEKEDQDILKIDCFFKEYKARKKLNSQKSTMPILKNLVRKTIKLDNTDHNKYITRINIKNYNNHFNFSTGSGDNSSYNCLNTDYNVTTKRFYGYGEDDVVTLANLVKKLDIRDNLKQEKFGKVKSPRYTMAINTISTGFSTDDYSPKATISSGTKTFRGFADVDSGFNTYTKYKPRRRAAKESVHKLNKLFESFCREERSAQDLLLNMGVKIAKHDPKYNTIGDFQTYTCGNPVRVAKLNIKRLYNK
jgi:hypothetical protein